MFFQSDFKVEEYMIVTLRLNFMEAFNIYSSRIRTVDFH